MMDRSWMNGFLIGCVYMFAIMIALIIFGTDKTEQIESYLENPNEYQIDTIITVNNNQIDTTFNVTNK